MLRWPVGDGSLLVFLGRNFETLDITRRLVEGLTRVRDPKTGLWYQVVDKGAEHGNWHDSSGSGMFVYAIQRAIDFAWMPPGTRPWSGRGSPAC